MSTFGPSGAQPVPGVPMTPHVSHSNPDRHRGRDQQQQSKKKDAPPHRESDSAELTAPYAESHAPAEAPHPPPHAPPAHPDDHPHIDVQG